MLFLVFKPSAFILYPLFKLIINYYSVMKSSTIDSMDEVANIFLRLHKGCERSTRIAVSRTERKVGDLEAS